MENHTYKIPVCDDCKQRIEQMAEFFGWDDAESMIGAMLDRELERAADRMHAELFRMHHHDLVEIIEAKKQREDQNRLN